MTAGLPGWLGAVAAAGALLVTAPARASRLPLAEPVPPPGGRPLVAGWWVVLSLACGGAILTGPAAGVVAGLAGSIVVRRLRVRAAAAARAGAAAAVVEIAGALAGELYAGRTPAQALTAAQAVAGPYRDALAEAGRRCALGLPAAPVLRAAGGVGGAGGMRAVAALWDVVESTGAPAAEALDRLGRALDDQAAVASEAAAALAAPRTTVRLLAALPLAGLGLGQLLGAAPLHLLTGTIPGAGLAVLAGGLDLAGLGLFRLLSGPAP